MSTFNADAASYLQDNFLLEGERELCQYHQRVIQCAVAADPNKNDSLHDCFAFALNHGFAYCGNASGSINLTSFVRDAMTETAVFDHYAVAAVVQPALRLLDNMAQKNNAELSVSIVGLAETLMLIGKDYTSYQGRRIAAHIMRTIRDECFDASIRLAVERGANPSLDVESYLTEGYGKGLPSDFRDDIRRYGRRHRSIMNVEASAVAPVAFFDGVSPGFLPPPNWSYTWTLRQRDGSVCQVSTTNPVFSAFGTGMDTLPPHCKTALELKHCDYDQMLGAVEKFVDGFIAQPETFYVNQLNRSKPSALVPAKASRPTLGCFAPKGLYLQRVLKMLSIEPMASA